MTTELGDMSEGTLRFKLSPGRMVVVTGILTKRCCQRLARVRRERGKIVSHNDLQYELFPLPCVRTHHSQHESWFQPECPLQVGF